WGDLKPRNPPFTVVLQTPMSLREFPLRTILLLPFIRRSHRLIWRSGYGRKQEVKPLYKCRVRQNGFTERGVRESSNYCDLNRVHNLTSVDCEACEPKNAIAVHLNQGLEESPRFRKCAGA